MRLQLIICQVICRDLLLWENIGLGEIQHGLRVRGGSRRSGCQLVLLLNLDTVVIWYILLILYHRSRDNICLWPCQLRHLFNVILDMLFDVNLGQCLLLFRYLSRATWVEIGVCRVCRLLIHYIFYVLTNFLLTNLHSKMVTRLIKSHQLTIGIETTKSLSKVCSAFRSIAS